jgi:hypothetical protein
LAHCPRRSSNLLQVVAIRTLRRRANVERIDVGLKHAAGILRALAGIAEKGKRAA